MLKKKREKTAVLYYLNISYRLIRIVLSEDLLCLLLSSVSEEHDDLVAVGPCHICLSDKKVHFFLS